MPDEKLGRRVSSRSNRRLVQRGTVPLKLFIRKCTYELSVDRLHDDYFSEITAIADEYDKNRERNFYGWAAVSQEIACRNGRYLKLSPKTYNKFHADIVLPISVVSDKDEREKHATELAAFARWQDRVESHSY